MTAKEKRIVFSEVIDNKINGFAVGVGFSIISLFLLSNDTYYGLKWITYIVGAAFGFLGVAGIGIELDKNRKIKGIFNISLGLVFLGVWLAAFLLMENDVLTNVLATPVLVLGTYALTRGLFEFLYSLWLAIVASKRSVTKVVKVLFVFVTQLCGLALTILNILKIFELV